MSAAAARNEGRLLGQRFADAISGYVSSISAGRPLAVVFSGLRGDDPVPRYEFGGALSSLDVSVVFVRDLWQAWYMRGVPGLGDDLAEVAAALATIASRSEAPRVVCIGASAGGFAAVAVATMAGFDGAHAFAPQTSIRLRSRARLYDRRWSTSLLRAHAIARTSILRDGDLRTLAHSSGYRPEVVLHVGDCSADKRAVHRLKDIENMRVVEHDAHGHAFVHQLRETGALQDILSEALLGRTD